MNESGQPDMEHGQFPPAAPTSLELSLEAAGEGRYEEAHGLLDGALQQEGLSEVDALDLRARMHAQQGLYLEAERCWTRARDLAGGTPRFDAALARLRAPRAPGTAPLARWAAAACILLAAAAVWIALSASHETRDGQTRLLTGVSRLESAHAGLEAQLAATEGRSQEALAALDVRLAAQSDAMSLLRGELASKQDLERSSRATQAAVTAATSASSASTADAITGLEQKLEAARSACVRGIESASASVGELAARQAKVNESVEERFGKVGAALDGVLEMLKAHAALKDGPASVTYILLGLGSQDGMDARQGAELLRKWARLMRSLRASGAETTTPPSSEDSSGSR